MKSSELRRQYLEFFRERGHKLLPSSSLVPNDPSLLFTAAGMVQFKEFFWGRLEPSFTRATTCQKCFRTTDIEEVGRTAYHQTFFEMLGNFSFGDYFKQGAIELAWAFLTEELGIQEERLAVSVFEEDEEAAEIWHDVIGLPASRIVRLGKKHNWWGPVGPTGPCGPDSEIHYDSGADNACGPDCDGVACDCNRFSEIWNLVFMQFEAQEDGTLVPLAKKNIDTGMGLERTTGVLQGVGSNFDTDLFVPIIDAIEAAAPRSLTATDRMFRNTIADHIRGALFLVADGVMPGNERQGYVLRRILRRAIRASEKLDIRSGTIATFVEPVVEVLGDVYPEIVAAREITQRLIAREEETFRRTLRDGERRLDKHLGDLAASEGCVLPGEVAFELTDTYGFPFEMTQEIAREHGIAVDVPGFTRALEAQRTRSRAGAADRDSGATENAHWASLPPTRFIGYEHLHGTAVVAYVEHEEGRPTRLVFSETPFYAESGGQVADAGSIENLSRPGAASVRSVSKSVDGIYVHELEDVEGSFDIGDRCQLVVDDRRRRRIERNHTATHLLHSALRDVLGPHAQQAGSVVSDEELRFDFSHFEGMTETQIARVEDVVNEAILADHAVITEELSLDAARGTGAIGLFDDQYQGHDLVRVVRVDGISKELCGGTHVRRSGEIGLFRVTGEEGIASGVRRIRAVTGDAILERLREEEALIGRLRSNLGEDPEAGLARLRQQLDALQTEMERLLSERLRAMASDLAERKEEIGGVRFIAVRADLAPEPLVSLADLLEDRLRPAVVVLVSSSSGRGFAVCKVSEGVTTVRAGDVVREMTARLGGGGGGSRSFAQGGGPKADQAAAALDAGRTFVRTALGAGT